MQLFDSLYEYFFRYDSPLYWRDVLEVLFFSALFYYAALWLKKDRQKNLVLALYGYCTMAFGAHYLGLTTISYIMFLFAPAAAMVFIVLHQEFLQKNFITFKNITPARFDDQNWIEALIRTFLIRGSNHALLLCVIEHKDNLTDLMQSYLPINARAEQGVLDLILTSPSFDAQKLLWANTSGHIIGINTDWKKTDGQINSDTQTQELAPWKQQAIFFTSKTDALVLSMNTNSRTFDVIINGMIIDRMHATKAIELIKKYSIAHPRGGQNRETFTQKPVAQQRTH